MISKNSAEKTDFSKKLLAWYDVHGRTLPWRFLPPDPYTVWVSEIMLQQTTVVTVTPYFELWLQRWPTVQKLERASIMEVLRAWQGLGYYHRARHLHKCAKIIVEEFSGFFPEDEATLRTLPGIGFYTAAAIAAIAFEQPACAVDGNIARVFSRVLCLPESGAKLLAAVRQQAKEFLPKTRRGDYTQALMDFGGAICRAQTPLCDECPVQAFCKSYQEGCTEAFPKKPQKKVRPEKHGHFFFLRDPETGAVCIAQEQEALLHHLWRPLRSNWSAAASRPNFPCKAPWREFGHVRHIFTHFALNVTLWVGDRPENWPIPPEAKWVTAGERTHYPFSTLARKAFQRFDME